MLLVLLMFGTQMPGAWRDEAFRVTQLPWQLTKAAHFVLFLCMACVARLPLLRWSLARVALAGLGLALLSEGLQFFASSREPSWQDVAIDMAGAATGVLFAQLAASAKGR